MKWKIDKTKIKWLCYGTLSCVSVYFMLYLLQSNRASSPCKEGEEYLQAQASLDVSEVSKQVAMANQAIQLANASSLEEELRIRFQNSIVVGDSIAEAFDEYDLLTPSNVVASRGMRTDNCEEDINRVIALAPENVFLSYGMNDLEYCRGDEVCFASQYELIIEKLQNELPSAKIYVSALLPTTKAAEASIPVYKAYSKYNEALKALCLEMKVMYYDCGDLLLDEQAYESDGVHPKFAYYPLWLQRMVDIAGL